MSFSKQVGTRASSRGTGPAGVSSRARPAVDPRGAGEAARPAAPHPWPCGPETSAPRRDLPEGSSPARPPARRRRDSAETASWVRVPGSAQHYGPLHPRTCPPGPCDPAQRFRGSTRPARPAHAHDAASARRRRLAASAGAGPGTGGGDGAGDGARDQGRSRGRGWGPGWVPRAGFREGYEPGPHPRSSGSSQGSSLH